MKKYLGFMDFESARKVNRVRNRSTILFQGDCVPEYTLWQRIRLAVLLVLKVDLSELHVPIRRGNIKKVMQWVEEMRKVPGVPEAFEIAAGLRSERIRCVEAMKAMEVTLSDYIYLGACGCTEPGNDPISGHGYNCVFCQDTGAVIEMEKLVEKAKEQRAIVNSKQSIETE